MNNGQLIIGVSPKKLAIIAFVIPHAGVILSEARSAKSKDLNTESDVSTSIIPHAGVILSEARSAESKDLNTESDVSTALHSAQHDGTIS